MALQLGTRLGNFEILDPLGSGGMGEVYRALDTRLGGRSRSRRFPRSSSPATRSAWRGSSARRGCSRLSTIRHRGDLRARGSRRHAFIVMELVPGETLSEKLSNGPLPLDEALKIARQIADALEAAHERGIIHRDLKPANIKVTPEGRVKVLDLGLAKASMRSGSDPDALALPDARHRRHAARRHPRDRGVHEPRAGAGQGRGQADRHLVFRLRPLRAL